VVLSCFSISTGGQWIEWAESWLASAFNVFRCLPMRAQRDFRPRTPPLTRALTTHNTRLEVARDLSGHKAFCDSLWMLGRCSLNLLWPALQVGESNHSAQCHMLHLLRCEGPDQCRPRKCEAKASTGIVSMVQLQSLS
jgi:hypothetical protein